MSDINLKLSGTYDSIEANDILEQMRSMGKNYEEAYDVVIETEQKAENALNATQTALNAVNAKIAEVTVLVDNANTYANNARGYSETAVASRNQAVSSATNAKTSEDNAKASETLTVETAEQFADDIANINTELSNRYTKSETNSLLDKKANSNEVYTKTEVDSKLEVSEDVVANIVDELNQLSDFINDQVGNQNASINSTYITLPEYGSVKYSRCGYLAMVSLRDVTVKPIANGEYIIASGIPKPLVAVTFFVMSQEHNTKLRLTIKENNGVGVIYLDWNGNISSAINSLSNTVTYICYDDDNN